MATVVQNPGVPTQMAPLITGEEGNGKNFFFDMFAAIFGDHNCVVTTNLKDFDRFNSSLEGKALIIVNEMTDLTSQQWSHLRGMITDATIRVEEKGLDVRHVKNVANIVFLSNVVHRELFPDIGTNVRRIVHFPCRNVTKPPLMWDHFWEWAGGRGINHTTTRKKCDGSMALADYLSHSSVSSTHSSS